MKLLHYNYLYFYSNGVIKFIYVDKPYQVYKYTI